GGELACGTDGELYVTQAGRVQRMLFSGSGSNSDSSSATGAGPGPVADRAGADDDSAGHALYPLLLASGLLAVTLARLLWGRAALRHPRTGARPGRRQQGPTRPPPAACPP